MTRSVTPTVAPKHVPRARTAGRSRVRRGLVLIGLLLVMLLAGVLSLKAATVWATAVQREREAELLFVGDQYRRAIRSYYLGAPPGQPRVLPRTLEDLVDDKRSVVSAHHLRRLYADPITGAGEWGLVMRGERISGVHSLSEARPVKRTGFEARDSAFEDRESYGEWLFVYVPPAPRRRGAGPS